MSKKYVIQTEDKDGIDILLGDEEWKNHILVRHPEIKPFLNDIKKAVKNPNERQVDPEDERVYLNYYQNISI